MIAGPRTDGDDRSAAGRDLMELRATRLWRPILGPNQPPCQGRAAGGGGNGRGIALKWCRGDGTRGELCIDAAGGHMTGDGVDHEEPRHPDLQRLLAYWRRQCGSRLFPRRGDIDPVDFSFMLERIALTE